jgi:hypothetical protein
LAAEPVVLTPVWVVLTVFVPQQLKGNMFSFEFRIDVIEGRQATPFYCERDGGRGKEVC